MSLCRHGLHRHLTLNLNTPRDTMTNLTISLREFIVRWIFWGANSHKTSRKNPKIIGTHVKVLIATFLTENQQQMAPLDPVLLNTTTKKQQNMGPI